ncbi:hypothetical protein BCV70DRAFT_125495 [Testicularia cyperi]|uniref:Uncharacterized protein n=1 Tax=Testicularia cyperi TaxID=1882483 RepID=A0A317XMP5_9BASI|nr:hypothetical protein BCV70DRAFT_125495 [Testicularia cyperi]
MSCFFCATGLRSCVVSVLNRLTSIFPRSGEVIYCQLLFDHGRSLFRCLHRRTSWMSLALHFRLVTSAALFFALLCLCNSDCTGRVTDRLWRSGLDRACASPVECVPIASVEEFSRRVVLCFGSSSRLPGFVSRYGIITTRDLQTILLLKTTAKKAPYIVAHQNRLAIGRYACTRDPWLLYSKQVVVPNAMTPGVLPLQNHRTTQQTTSKDNYSGEGYGR